MVCFLFSYLIEGRRVVQATVLDCAFSFVAAALLMAAGGKGRRQFKIMTRQRDWEAKLPKKTLFGLYFLLINNCKSLKRRTTFLISKKH